MIEAVGRIRTINEIMLIEHSCKPKIKLGVIDMKRNQLLTDELAGRFNAVAPELYYSQDEAKLFAMLDDGVDYDDDSYDEYTEQYRERQLVIDYEDEY